MSVKTIDDRDSSISYTAGWDQLGGPNEYNGTTSRTFSKGQSATLAFSGTGVSVFGTITYPGLGDPPTSVYSVDGGPETTFAAVQLSNIQYKQQFFNSGVLRAGNHRLVISCGTENGYLYLDYFEVTQVAGAKTSLPSTSSGSSTVVSKSSASAQTTSFPSASVSSSLQRQASLTTSGPSVGTVSQVTEVIVSTAVVTGASGSSASDTSRNPSHASHSVSVGPIIGGVVAGIICLAALFALLVCRRRRRAGQVTFLPISPGPGPNGIAPFQLDIHPSPPSEVPQNSDLYSRGQFSALLSVGNSAPNVTQIQPMSFFSNSSSKRTVPVSNRSTRNYTPTGDNTIPPISSDTATSYAGTSHSDPLSIVPDEKSQLENHHHFAHPYDHPGRHNPPYEDTNLGQVDPPPSYNAIRYRATS